MWVLTGWITFFLITLFITLRKVKAIHKNQGTQAQSKVYLIMFIWGLLVGLALFASLVLIPTPGIPRPNMSDTLFALLTNIIVFPLIATIGTWRVYNKKYEDEVNQDIRNLFRKRKK